MSFGWSEGIWPYVVIVVVGVLPTIVWRILGLFMASGLREDSEILVWVRMVASALLIAVVAKLLVLPTGTLASIPAWGRFGAVLAGVAALFLTKRSVLAAVAVGEAVLVAASLAG